MPEPVLDIERDIEDKKKALPEYSEELFREKIAVLNMDEEEKHALDLWWQQEAELSDWLARSEKISDALPSGSPEKQDARAAFKGAREVYDEINARLTELIERPTVPSARSLLVEPILSQFRVSPEVVEANTLAQMTEDFKDKYWTLENDQIVAISEAVIETGSMDLERVRMQVAQWSFEEFIESIPRQKLYILYRGMENQSLVDELEIEKMELKSALARQPWSSEKREKFRRLHHRLLDVMDTIGVPGQTKRDFNEAFDYATGHRGKTVSAMDILQNAEAAWFGFKNDATLQEFWQYEQEKLDEATEK